MKNMTSVEYLTFHRAKGRCSNPNNAKYPYYGGRGIEFRLTSINELLDTIGRRPSKDHSLDRIDVNGHYEVGNIRWATREEQTRNQRSNIEITYKGRTQCVTAWCKELNLNYRTIKSRLYLMHWDVERALETPCAPFVTEEHYNTKRKRLKLNHLV